MKLISIDILSSKKSSSLSSATALESASSFSSQSQVPLTPYPPQFTIRIKQPPHQSLPLELQDPDGKLLFS